MKKAWIYLAGVVVFGFSYAWLKAVMSEQAFVVAALAYLLLLRLLADRLGR